MKIITNNSDRIVVENPECNEIIRNLLRIISCEIRDETNRKKAIELVKQLCTSKWD